MAAKNGTVGYEPAGSVIIGMPDNIQYHTLNIVFGATCFAFNIPLFFIFVTSRALRNRFQILIALNIADAMNCLAIFFMGINRVQLYTAVLNTNLIPIRNSWQCATEPWLLLRGIGDLWPPIIQLLMGCERFIAVSFPLLYKKLGKHRTTVMIIPSIVFVIISLLIGFAIAFYNRDVKTKYFCGRKAAFSNEYGVFIYTTNIVGYFFGLFFNVWAVIKALSTITLSGKHQLKRIRYTLLISLLSMILVSIPNAISIMSALFVDVADAISKPSSYFTCVNSGINFFIYIVLNNEFRNRVKELLGFKVTDINASSKLFVSTAATKTARL